MAIIVLGNTSTPVWHQTNIYTKADLSIGTLEKNITDISITRCVFKKVQLNNIYKISDIVMCSLSHTVMKTGSNFPKSMACTVGVLYGINFFTE